MEKIKWKDKDKKQKRDLIISVCLWSLACIILILAICYSIFYSSDTPTDAWNDFSKALEAKIPVIIRSLVLIIATLVISKIIRFILRKVLASSKKGKTISTMIDSFVKYAAAIIMILLLLSAWGVNTSTLLASAGILGLVIGLGAQSLISDILSGLFIVFEGSYQVGDIIVIDGYRGEVKEIGIRTTKVIDAGGNVKIVNNSTINNIVNMTSDLSLAICTVGVEYGDSLERIEVVLKNNLDDIKTRIPAIIEGPYYKGVEELGNSSVVLKIVARCKEEDKFQTTRDLNREIKIIFDKNGVNIPFPQVVVNQPTDFKQATNKEIKSANVFVAEQKELSKELDQNNND